MQHENVEVMFFMLFHAVPCCFMPCYSPKSGETATDTKHANFDWRTLEAMQVQHCELRISNETLSVRTYQNSLKVLGKKILQNTRFHAKT
jgi:hypothetical protein